MKVDHLIRRFTEEPKNAHYQNPTSWGEELIPEPLKAIWLPRVIHLSNGTRTRSIEVGEDFVLTVIAIEEKDGQKYIVTEIGILKIE